jgi:cell division protein FtsN
MGLVKLLFKAILIPIVLVIVFAVAIVLLIKMRREKKAKERELQNNAFQPPPIQQWAYPSPVQKPEAAMYSKGTPGQMEQGIVHS